ncbi:MAG TPA: hypothetical protein PLI13_01600 [Paracoccus sp. (in: a-proteobacteria)]|nr:hypothetical protein [Paracoccus sp. (in: a-proteobacteria)]
MTATGRHGAFGRAMALAILILCLALSPVIVSATHGPALTVTAEDITHGHSHADPTTDGFSGHDATDHEHLGTDALPDGALLLHGGPGAVPMPEGWSGVTLARQGPRRPPRAG